MFLNAASKFHFFNILNLNTIVIFAKQRGLGCQFQASIVCCKRFSFQLKIFNFQWSVYQLMRAAKNMGGVSFCARRCVLLFMLLKYTTAFYSPLHPPPPWCITFQCIPCSVLTLELDKLYIANQLKNVAIIMAQLEENG